MFILAKYQTQILYKMKCRLENRQLEKYIIMRIKLEIKNLIN